MKYLKIGLCLCLLLCAAGMNAQDIPLSLRADNKPLGKVLDNIKELTGYNLIYNVDHVDLNRPVSINAKNQKLSTILDKAFKGTKTTFSIGEKVIVLSSKEVKTADNKSASGQTPTQTARRTITGTVTDAAGESLIGVTVMEKGKKGGVVTDFDGNYTISVEGKKPVLQFSYVGYEPMTVEPGDRNVQNVMMKENNDVLEEVVVVGYGTMKKKDLTGAVSQVKINESTASTVNSISNALQGKAAGLQVNMNSAQPGSSASFLIRGAGSTTDNSPLIIIDGFPVSPYGDNDTGYYSSGSTDNVFGSLNPNDIESIDVLKDASSTAIYGSRAGHGVILITTKKGAQGKAKVSYSGSASIQQMSKHFDLLDAPNFMLQTNRYEREKWMIDNKIGIYGGVDASSVAPYEDRYSPEEIAAARTTDWMGAVTRRGFQTSHNLSVTGGTEWTKYLVSGGFMRQEGVVKGNDMNRFNLRTNIEQKFNRHFKGGVNIALSRIDEQDIPVGAGANENAPVLTSAYQGTPNRPIRDEEGNYTINPLAAFLPNAVSLLEIDNNIFRNRFLGSLYLEYKPIEAVTLKANVGMDYNNSKRKVYLPKTTLYGQKANGRADICVNDNNDYLMEFTAAFNKSWGDHSLNAVAGYSYQTFKKESVYASNSDFLSDGMSYNNLGIGNYPKPGVASSYNSDEMASFFARASYSYAGRYLVTATMRADGSSYFAKGHQWGYFPSVSLGWRFSEEKFMDAVSTWWSNGKIRASFGKTGNSNIGYQSISLYSDHETWKNYNAVFGGTQHIGIQLSQLGNPNITWETTTEWNFGLDLGFLHNRINFVGEYYIRKISDLLVWRPLQSSQIVTSIADNFGSTRSHGLELTLNTVNIQTRDWNWTTDLTFSFYRDRWDKRSDSWVANAYDVYNAPMRAMYGYKSAGLIQPGEEVEYMSGATPGMVKLLDWNGYVLDDEGNRMFDKHGIALTTGEPDGQLDEADCVYYGTSDPDFIMGLNNTLRWKNFDLNIYFYGEFNKLVNGSYRDWQPTNMSEMSLGLNKPNTVTEIWSSDNLDGWRPGYAQERNLYGTGDFFLKKCWFVRCRNITLGYRIPTGKALANLRVFADVTNPFVFTNYNGMDPETDDCTYPYPNVRSYSIGLELTF